MSARRCRASCEELANAEASPSGIVLQGKAAVSGERRSKRVRVSSETTQSLSQQLGDLKPELEEHYGIPLGRFDEPQFLMYEKGDHFGYHVDGLASATGPGYLRSRIVSVVVFLNSQSASDADHEFGGGSLTIYSLGGHTGALSVQPTQGLLVAFPSRTYHKVEVVTRGRRYTAVSWFHAPSTHG